MYTYLKFGLPRVFPPNGSRHRDGSSGYDSSDDGMSPRNVQQKKSQSYYLRTRSDPDFRNTPYYGVSFQEESSFGVMAVVKVGIFFYSRVYDIRVRIYAVKVSARLIYCLLKP